MDASRSTDSPSLRLLASLVLVLSLACLLLRWHGLQQAAALPPATAVTSGFEEESLLALWQAAHGLPAYTHPADLPFRASYFNWLFYWLYGTALGPGVASRGAEALLLDGRAFTALFTGIACAALLWAAWRASPWPKSALAALAIFTTTGPLVGWWGFTLRPDAAALACECLGLALLLYRRPAGSGSPDRTVRPAVALLSGLCFGAAWAFKQNALAGLLTAVAFLLLRRAYAHALICAAAAAVFPLASLLFATPAYLQSMQDTLQNNRFNLAQGLNNLKGLFLKTAPLWLALPLALLARPPSRRIATRLAGLFARLASRDASLPASFPASSAPTAAAPLPATVAATPSATAPSPADDLRLVGLLGLALSLPLSFLGSCKIGAWTNYYFFPTVALALCAASAPVVARPSRALLLVVLAGCALLQGLVVAGVVGQLDLRPQARALADRWEVWKAMPEPRFSHDARLALPWLNRATPPFVLAYNYPNDRWRGLPFERGGIGGLIEQGYFASLLLPPGTESRYDGASLSGYDVRLLDDGWRLLRRRGAETP